MLVDVVAPGATTASIVLDVVLSFGTTVGIVPGTVVVFDSGDTDVVVVLSGAVDPGVVDPDIVEPGVGQFRQAAR